ncbi:Cysteine protease atg4 [Rhizina undulata]
MNSMSLPSFNEGLQRLVQKFLWDPEPKNSDPMNNIWCLGIEYPSIIPPSPAPPPPSTESSSVLPDIRDGGSFSSNSIGESTWPQAFLDDLDSRIWMTYRSDFKAIPKSTESTAGLSFLTSLRSQLPDHAAGFTSDAGWGCMIRSGQCVLANALLHHRFGRGWRRGANPEGEKKLLQLFADDPKAPFSIHKFVKHGEQACGKRPGEWFGPSAAARCIQALSNDHGSDGLRVYITGDGGDVYEDSFRKIAIVDGQFRPTLVLVGIRLGIERVTPVYWEALKACLQVPQSVGIAGGRPSSSHYFVGVQGDNFFYLDPHQCRQSLPYRDNSSKYTSEEVDSCHSRRLRRLHLREMDPSMLLAFLIKDEADWKEWRRGVEQVQGKRVIHVGDVEPTAHGHTGGPREEAIAEVEAFDDDDDEEGIQ